MDSALSDSVLRLARLLEEPQDIPLLAPMINYRLLNGPHGRAIAQVAQSGSHMQRIAEAIRQLKSNYDKSIKYARMFGNPPGRDIQRLMSAQAGAA